jgi:hypothetical protein
MGILAGDLIGLVRKLSDADLWPGVGRTWSIGPLFVAHRGNGMDQFSKHWLVLGENGWERPRQKWSGAARIELEGPKGALGGIDVLSIARFISSGDECCKSWEEKGDYSMTGDVMIARYVTMIRSMTRTTANGSW